MAAPSNETPPATCPTRRKSPRPMPKSPPRLHLITDHVHRQLKKGVSTPGRRTRHRPGLHGHDGQAAGQPVFKLAQAQMNLVWDYFSLWQHSMMRCRRSEPRRSPPPRRATALQDEEGSSTSVRLHQAVPT